MNVKRNFRTSTGFFPTSTWQKLSSKEPLRDELHHDSGVQIVTGDLLEAEAQYIVHQTNCVSHGKAAGLAAAIFAKYPWADIYADRVEYGEPGDISVHSISVSSGGQEPHRVINLNGQFFPGKPRYLTGFDSAKARLDYFHSALLSIGDLNARSIAFPYKISCGLAGGDWPVYLKMLNDFSAWKINTKVLVYQREGDV
jgi:O-acetyl-ADP-ribose deacetylase (regulator of RNase III)